MLDDRLQSEAASATATRPAPAAHASTQSPDSGARRRPIFVLLRELEKRAPRLKAAVQRRVVRFEYRAINRRYESTGRNCVNYGWVPLDDSRELPEIPPEQHADRLGLQLYWRVAAPGDIAGKDVLEVGCGRGAGTAFLATAMGARSVLGIDLTESSVKWCQQRWRQPNVTFRVGDAENIPLADGAVDAVVNLESAHNYPDITKFFAESFRVLRSGGVFLMADMCFGPLVDEIRQQISEAGFVLDEEEDISPNVVAALEADAALRSAWVNSNFPRLLRPAALEFAGTPGSGLFQALTTGDVRYMRFTARRP